MSELWDAYTSDGQKVEGIALVRGEEIPEKLNHLVCNILIRHDDGTYLITKRHPNKMYGGMWEASCGGSALKGESAELCALREMYEETGITPDSIEEIRHYCDPHSHCLYHVFFARTSCKKDNVRLQEGETVDYKWLTEKQLLLFQQKGLIVNNP